jgi:GAF domain-containing protein
MSPQEPSGSSASADPRSYVATRVADDANLGESLQRVAVAGCELLANCLASSVTIITANRAITMAATDDVAMKLDQAQYDGGDGPCLTAARHEQVIRVDDLDADSRWPRFVHAAQAGGVASSLSIPLLIDDDDTFGALNVYGEAAGAFSADDELVAQGFAAHAAIVVSNVVAYWEAIALSRNLSAAMEHRGVIEQAKGVLMGAHRISADDAFNLLRQRSQHENRKLRDVALEVVADTQPVAGA